MHESSKYYETKSFSVMGSVFKIKTNIEWLGEQFDLMFSKCVTYLNDSNLEIYMLKRQNGYNLKIWGICSEKYNCLYQMLESFKYKVFFENVWDRDKPPILFHAGMIEKNGQAVLLCGNAGTGKTTWVLEMLSENYKYMAEEIAVFDTNIKKCITNPFPIAIRNKESVMPTTCIKLNDLLYEKFMKEKLQLWTAPLKNSDSCEIEAELSGIIFLERSTNNMTACNVIEWEEGLKLCKKFYYTRGTRRECQYNEDVLKINLQKKRFVKLEMGTYESTRKSLCEILEEFTT